MASISLFTVTGLFKIDLLNQIYSMLINYILLKKEKLAASIYNSINPNASNISEIVSVSSKLFAYDTGFNLKQEEQLNLWVAFLWKPPFTSG